MKLDTIKYQELIDTPRAWELDELDLGGINLLVGKNASGKTRVLNIIKNLALRLTSNRQELFESGGWKITLSDNDEKYHYLLEVQDRQVIREKLTRGRKVLLDRKEGGFGKIFAEKEGKEGKLIKFQTPPDQLAAVARQDTFQHPFLVAIRSWADSVLHFEFGSNLGRNHLAVNVSDKEPQFDPKKTDQIVPVFREGQKEFGDDFAKIIATDMNDIGYSISEVGTRVPEGIQILGPVNTNSALNIYVKEKELEGVTDQIYMSQGMFRALSVITQLNFGIMFGSGGCLLIDDVGEGLDFERSTSLISLLRKKMKGTNSQLIMTTNDRYTMNQVPLEEWTILNREGSVVHVLNLKNSKKRFEEFKFTGLSNFDFFSSEFALNDT